MKRKKKREIREIAGQQRELSAETKVEKIAEKAAIASSKRGNKRARMGAELYKGNLTWKET